MTPEQQVKAAVAKLPAGKVKYVKGWNSKSIAGKGAFNPKFVMLHHTAGLNSLAFMTRANGTWGPVRLAHFLVQRDGVVQVCAAVKTYHAGKGGPRFGVSAGAMNIFSWGIEIEDLGKGQTMTAAQVESAAILTAGLIDAMGQKDDRIIQHKEWNPSGKTDTRYSTAFWREQVAAARKKVVQVSKVVKASKAGPLVKHSGKVGSSTPYHKTPILFPVTVVGGQRYTAATLDLPEGRYIVSFQVRMPKELAKDGEVELARLGWGEAKPGEEDSTGHNKVEAAQQIGNKWYRWRTPIEHPMAGGGKVAFHIMLPEGGAHKMRFVCKATRIA